MGPLQTLICETVPAERLGEANGVMGSAKSMTALLAYIITAGISAVMETHGLNAFQWAFFAAASCISSGMLLFAVRLKLPSKPEAKVVDASRDIEVSDNTSSQSIP